MVDPSSPQVYIHPMLLNFPLCRYSFRGMLFIALIFGSLNLPAAPYWVPPGYGQAPKPSSTPQPATSYWPGLAYPPAAQPQPGFPSGTTPYNYWRQPTFGYSFPQAATQLAAPTLETSISERRPLVQQNLIFRARLFSAGNLSEASPRPPQSEAVIFKQLETPKNIPVSGKDGYSQLTEYVYLLIPIRAGTVELPPFQVDGKYNNGTSFSVQSKQGTQLFVQPRQSDTEPWLPLYDLRLNAELADDNTVKAGEPLILKVTLSATGATGAQLPSVAGQMHSDDFNIYPGETATSGQISANGLDLIGSRTEIFTLVPKFGGRLMTPAISIPWWDLRTGQASIAGVPSQLLQVNGPVDANKTDSSGFFSLPEGRSLWFWIPLLLVIALVLVSWLRVLVGNGKNPLTQWLAQQTHNLLGDLYQPLAQIANSISPRRHFHRLRTWIGRQLPVSWKLWYCLRAVDQEEDPQTWGHALQILAAKHLGVRPNADLQQLGQSIVACHPNADPAQVARLMRELDQSIYGGKTLASFGQWKKQFKRQIHPRLFPIRLRSCGETKDRGELPLLNPQH